MTTNARGRVCSSIDRSIEPSIAHYTQHYTRARAVVMNANVPTSSSALHTAWSGSPDLVVWHAALDVLLDVGLPTVAESEEILRVHVGRMMLHKSTAVDKLCSTVASHCLGFSGADLAALCRAAAVRCVSSGSTEHGVTEQHFTDAMQDVIRSSNDTLVQRIASWQP